MTSGNTEYEDYNNTCDAYEQIRTTPAWDIISKEITETAAGRLGLPVNELVVLDAGCGTGLYSDKMKNLVKEVKAMDQNEGMLRRCHEKFDKCSNVTILKSSLLEELPLADQSVHVVMINQVIHHLESEETISTWSNTKKLVQEFHRVLIPGGLLAINHCSDGQALHGLWYYDLFSKYAELFQQKYIAMDKLEEILLERSYENIKIHKIVELSLKDKFVFDLEGCLNEEFRKADSFWALVQNDDLSKGLKKWKRMLDSNEASKFVEEREKLRHEFGHVCEIFCYKEYDKTINSRASSKPTTIPA